MIIDRLRPSWDDPPSVVHTRLLPQDAATERLMCKAPGSRIWQLLAQPGMRGIATEKEDADWSPNISGT